MLIRWAVLLYKCDSLFFFFFFYIKAKTTYSTATNMYSVKPEPLLWGGNHIILLCLKYSMKSVFIFFFFKHVFYFYLILLISLWSVLSHPWHSSCSSVLFIKSLSVTRPFWNLMILWNYFCKEWVNCLDDWSLETLSATAWTTCLQFLVLYFYFIFLILFQIYY